MPAVREEWRQNVTSLTGVISCHSIGINVYIQTHGPMTRQEVIERALSKLLSDARERLIGKTGIPEMNYDHFFLGAR